MSDVERDWVITTPETLEELNNLKTKNERKKVRNLGLNEQACEMRAHFLVLTYFHKCGNKFLARYILSTYHQLSYLFLFSVPEASTKSKILWLSSI